MKLGLIGWVVGVLTVVFMAAAIGVAIYLVGISSLAGLTTNNSLCCVSGFVLLVVLLFIILIVRGIWFESHT